MALPEKIALVTLRHEGKPITIGDVVKTLEGGDQVKDSVAFIPLRQSDGPVTMGSIKNGKARGNIELVTSFKVTQIVSIEAIRDMVEPEPEPQPIVWDSFSLEAGEIGEGLMGYSKTPSVGGVTNQPSSEYELLSLVCNGEGNLIVTLQGDPLRVVGATLKVDDVDMVYVSRTQEDDQVTFTFTAASQVFENGSLYTIEFIGSES